MSAELFPVAEAYEGDPLNPDLEIVTPDEVVAGLSPADRVIRMSALIDQAWTIYQDGIAEHLGGREIAATCLLFSGGNDSTTLAHLFRGVASHAIHANTGIGIEQTRQFVRDTCAAWGLPLIEKHAPVSYRDLVLDRGFPGPGMHWKMYTRLKERCLDAARADLITNSRQQRLVFIAGRRRAESERRKGVPLNEIDGSAIWVSPFAMWTKLDLNTYRAEHNVPRNEVADLIHMSGECLCGAYAKPGELDEIGHWFPDVAAEIRALEAEVAAAGWPEPLCRWGHGQGAASKQGRLCSSCQIPSIPMFPEATA
jgi:3'-phosphoadenosine 5'-phosphosulfate sulfotransferase (PAPS reductase)/FAD synthetase